METILGENEFRDCDHQAMNPVWAAELVAPDGGSGPAAVNTVKRVDGADALPSCGELGCDLG